MKYIRKVLLLIVAVFVVKTAHAAPLFIDAGADLTQLNIADKNAIPDGKTDSSVPVQAAIDYLAKNPEGGSLIFGPGVYRVGGIVVKPHVKIIGTSRDKTVFRAASRSIIFDMEGGELHNFTVYGTPDEAASGANWKVGTGGVGKGGSSWASFTIRVGNTPKLIAKDVIISNVTARECRYDCLYTRGSQNLRVINCDFDRAGRNIISLVGNDENFLIAGCRFGSLFGLYHSDIEPNESHFVRDGMFLNCEFDGSHAGEMNTGTWGAMFIFSGEEKMADRNITVAGCTFRDITTRIRGIFPDVQFLYNPQLGKFVKVRTNPVGELRDATIRGNRFGTPQNPLKDITSGVTFTGKSTFEGNTPEAANHTTISVESSNTQWQEDHPLAVKPTATNSAPPPPVITANLKEGKVLLIPLAGHRLNFATNTVLDNKQEGAADIIFHSDPLMAEGDAALQILPRSAWHQVPDLSNGKWEKSLWGIKAGDVVAVKTAKGRLVMMKILEQRKNDYRIQFRFVP